MRKPCGCLPDAYCNECFLGKEFMGKAEKKDERHGHPRFYELIDEISDLHSRKNHDYASGGDPLGNFKRVAKIFSMYPGLDLSQPIVVALTYAMKQVDASLWMLSNGHEAQVEGIADRLQDVAVYNLISMIFAELAATAKASDPGEEKEKRPSKSLSYQEYPLYGKLST